MVDSTFLQDALLALSLEYEPVGNSYSGIVHTTCVAVSLLPPLVCNVTPSLFWVMAVTSVPKDQSHFDSRTMAFASEVMPPLPILYVPLTAVVPANV